jgi:hypothetical protein
MPKVAILGVVVLVLTGSALAVDKPWQDGTVTAVSRVQVAREVEFGGFSLLLECTIETPTTIYVAACTGRHNPKAVIAAGPFNVGETLHFQIKHSHNSGSDSLWVEFPSQKPKPYGSIVRETPR